MEQAVKDKKAVIDDDRRKESRRRGDVPILLKMGGRRVGLDVK